jgi:hypothetical protein
VSAGQDPARAAELERRYRRLLRCYPPSHRAAHREEMLGVLLAAARPGQRGPGAAQTLNLIACGLAIRARRALDAGPRQDALALVSLIVPVLTLVFAALDVALSVRQVVALEHAHPPAPSFWALTLRPDFEGPVAVMIGWLAVVLLALAGRRRTATAVACVPLALDLAVLLSLVMQRTDAWSGGLLTFLWTAGSGPPVLASLAVCSLAFSAGPRRGLAIAGSRRAWLMIAGLSVLFGWPTVVIMANPSVQLPDSVFGLLDVLAVAVVIALTRRRGIASGRVAALLAIGFLPSLVGDFSFPDNQTVYAVFLLGSLLAAVLVWPVAITSWTRRARRTHQA